MGHGLALKSRCRRSMIGATDREDRRMSSPRSSLYRGLAEQPSTSPPIPASPALSIVPRGSTAAARKVAEVFSLAGIEIGGHRPWDLQVHDCLLYTSDAADDLLCV